MAKKSWPDLVGLEKNNPYPRFIRMLPYRNLNEVGKQAHFNRAFLDHHRQANEILMSKDGHPLAAVYFTPHGLTAKERTEFFKELQKRMGTEDQE